MNYLFLVVSETLYERIPILEGGSGPDEPYKIVCLVSAKTREQARWAAWRTDRTFDGDARDMPNFRTRKIGVAPAKYGSREVIEEEFRRRYWNARRTMGRHPGSRVRNDGRLGLVS